MMKQNSGANSHFKADLCKACSSKIQSHSGARDDQISAALEFSVDNVPSLVLDAGVYRVPYFPPPRPLQGGGGFHQVYWGKISSCEDGKGIPCHTVTIIKGDRMQYHYPSNLNSVRKNIKWVRRGRKFSDKKNLDFKKWGLGRISSCR